MTMQIDPLWSMAFLGGLLGSGHCLGMCGALVAALGLSGRDRPGGLFFHLAYNAGRIVSYSAIGALVGLLGAGLVQSKQYGWPVFFLLLLSDLLVIVVGLSAAGLLRRRDFLSPDCAGPMALIGGLVRRLAGLPAPLAAFPLGLMMGLLPCGFLYAMFISAGQSGSVQTATLTMFFFGLGTSPALLLFGSAAHLLSSRSRRWMLTASGLVVVCMGIYNLIRHLRMFDWLVGVAAFPWCCFSG